MHWVLYNNGVSVHIVIGWCLSSIRVKGILVPRGRDPSGLRQELRPLAAPNFWACAECSFCVFQPIRFVIFDNEFVNRGLLVLEAARGLDSWRRPEGPRPLGTRMSRGAQGTSLHGVTRAWSEYIVQVILLGKVFQNLQREQQEKVQLNYKSTSRNNLPNTLHL